MPRMRNAPASPNARGVRLGNSKCGDYRRYCDSRKSWQNFLAVGFLVKPFRFVQWIPGFQSGCLAPLTLSPPCLCYRNGCIQWDQHRYYRMAFTRYHWDDWRGCRNSFRLPLSVLCQPRSWNPASGPSQTIPRGLRVSWPTFSLSPTEKNYFCHR